MPASCAVVVKAVEEQLGVRVTRIPEYEEISRWGQSNMA